MTEDFFKINQERLFSVEKITEEIEKMNSFGARLTGSPAHNNFIKYLKDQIREMGYKTYSDPFYFDRWEEKRSKIVLHGETEDIEIPVSSAFPYSGETDENGITAELKLVDDKRFGYIAAQDKIAVVKVSDITKLSSSIPFSVRKSMPKNVEMPEKYNGPVATTFLNFPFLKHAKKIGVKAVICVWENFSDLCVEGQYLPFILGYHGIPALWVNYTNGEKIINAAKNGRTATLTLEAEKEENAYSETFYTIVEGTDKKNSIIVNTHTDGTNCIEENGPIALLSMMKYLKDYKPEKTIIFVFVTGHFRLSAFGELTSGVQATSKWLTSHKELWNGKDGHLKAVAGLSVEHLGSKLFKDVDGVYTDKEDIETELCYTGNKTMDNIYYRACKGREHIKTITLRGHNMLHFGEGQPLFHAGIPEISIVPAPDCLCVISDNHEMDKFDANLMYEQTESFIKMLLILDKMSPKDIGKCDRYSLGVKQGKNK